MIEQGIDFSHEKDLNIDDLLVRIANYNKEADLELIRSAYAFAAYAHRNQKRSSGEPYIIHPLNVSATLVKLKMDVESIVAGLLHDVVEDCDVKPEEISSKFGHNTAQIVIGLTKISKIEFKSQLESQAENFRKMVVAMAKDLRVIIVKLADRMHNMRTLQYVSSQKQQKIAQETLDIYVPLASRLGINSLKGELEDLCLRYLHPDSYYRLAEKVAMKKNDRESYIQDTVKEIRQKLDEYMVECEVTGRPKNFYSIYKKMMKREVDFEQIQDLLAFRIITNSITDCYKSLGIIHASFTPIPGRFKDYIAIPKVNNYQSLHTTVVGPRGERIEIQIRTWEMHEVAEKGIAAHWKYKEQGSNLSSKGLEWINELLEFNHALQSNTEFMDVVKNDLDMGGVFIFTPSGDVKELRFGATPLDFAYAVHTEVGNKCVGAKVNGKIVPLKYRLKSGDSIEILTSKTQTPSKDWLKIVKTSRARTKIRQYLSKMQRDAGVDIGRQMLDNSLKNLKKNIKFFEKSPDLKKILENFNFKEVEELYFHLSSGQISTKAILSETPSVKELLKSKEDEVTLSDESFTEVIRGKARKMASKDNAVIVEGIDDVMVRLGKCCSPIPGDEIFGFITKGRGITIHNSQCHRIAELEDNRRVFVEWNPDYQQKHLVSIKVITHDKPGILSDLSRKINNIGINIRSAVAKSMPDAKGSFIFEVEVKDYSDLMSLVSTVEGHEEVIAVQRT